MGVVDSGNLELGLFKHSRYYNLTHAWQQEPRALSDNQYLTLKYRLKVNLIDRMLVQDKQD